jgi:hypothetical protein
MKKNKTAEFDLYTRGRDYFTKIFNETEGLKCVFLDNYTIKSVCLLFFRSQLFEYQIFDTKDISLLGDFDC